MENETKVTEGETSVMVQEEKAVAVDNGMGSLLQMAISQDIDVDKLEKLIELKNREDALVCKKEFDLHFSEMQREFEPVKKTKDGHNYKYAPLPVLQKRFNPIITKHGFSYKWREEAIEGGAKRVRLIITGWGHTDEESFFDVPIMTGTSAQNTVQVAGSRSTYGMRYSFKIGFGISEEGEDDDARPDLSFQDAVNYPGLIVAMESCNSLEELKASYRREFDALGSDNVGKAVLVELKNKKKVEIDATA